jgi:cytochrome c biogenesis protein CcmG/thiol:disulfide interchange protein DsbE
MSVVLAGLALSGQIPGSLPVMEHSLDGWSVGLSQRVKKRKRIPKSATITNTGHKMKKLSFLVVVLSLALVAFGCSKAETDSTGNDAQVQTQTETQTQTQNQTDISSDNENLPAGMLKSGEAPLAPDFTLKNVAGGTLTLSDYKGKVVILDFWDTWCPPCKKEIPGFIELQNKYGDKGLVVIGAAFGRYGEKAVADFAKEWKMNYPVVIADQMVNNNYGGIQSIPQ